MHVRIASSHNLLYTHLPCKARRERFTRLFIIAMYAFLSFPSFLPASLPDDHLHVMVPFICSKLWSCKYSWRAKLVFFLQSFVFLPSRSLRQDANYRYPSPRPFEWNRTFHCWIYSRFNRRCLRVLSPMFRFRLAPFLLPSPNNTSTL